MKLHTTNIEYRVEKILGEDCLVMKIKGPTRHSLETKKPNPYRSPPVIEVSVPLWYAPAYMRHQREVIAKHIDTVIEGLQRSIHSIHQSKQKQWNVK